MTVTTTYTNLRWGRNLTDLFDVALHPTRDGGAGNPLLIFRHTGGGSSGSKANLWDGTHYEMDKLVNYLIDPAREVHFDVVSVESDQASFDGSTMARGRRIQFPGIVTSKQQSTAGVRAAMRQYGSDPGKTILIGGSHGAYLTLLELLMKGPVPDHPAIMERLRRFDSRGFSQPVRGAVIWQLAYPDWRKIASDKGITFTGATVSGTSLTTPSNDSFAHYRFSTGDSCVITSGSATHGTYTVSAKNSNNDALTLATSAGSGTASGYLSTDQTYLGDNSGGHAVWSAPWFGTRVGTAGADGLYDHSDWDTISADLKAAISPQAWAEKGFVGGLPPTYFISFEDGAPYQHPYGNYWDASTGIGGVAPYIHNYNGAVELCNTIKALGVETQYEGYDQSVSTWTDYSLPARIYTWMCNRLQE